MRVCTVEGCGGNYSARGYCQRHYNQWKRNPSGVGAPIREYGPPRWARDPEMRKWCNTCARWLDEANFAKSRAALDGLQHACRECRAALYANSAESVRDSMRKRRFGLDRATFEAMLDAQGGACAICRTTDPGETFWHVDHDHSCCPSSSQTCGKCVRGLLCRGCNHGLGAFRDEPESLDAAAEYLRRNYIRERVALRPAR